MTIFQQTVDAVKVIYPKFSAACLSLSMRSFETGVQMTPKAQSIANSVQRTTTPYTPHTENRVKSIRFACRLSPATASVVKDEMVKAGYTTTQAFLEALLLEWLKSRPAVDETARRQEGETEPVSL